MLLLPAELHDVPDDQEIAFELQLLDQRELAFDLTAGFFVIRAEAFGARLLRVRLRRNDVIVSPSGTG